MRYGRGPRLPSSKGQNYSARGRNYFKLINLGLISLLLFNYSFTFVSGYRVMIAAPSCYVCFGEAHTPSAPAKHVVDGITLKNAV